MDGILDGTLPLLPTTNAHLCFTMRSDNFAHVTLSFRRRGDLWIRLARENNVVVMGSTLVVSCDVMSKMFVFAQLSWVSKVALDLRTIMLLQLHSPQK